MTRPPVPPFSRDDAVKKVRAAEDGWNTRDPQRVALAYTEDSRWRNRSTFVRGREEIVAFLTQKWERELAYDERRIAVRYAYESHDAGGQWWRSYGNENWEFADDGLMRFRHASINDLAIDESERKLHWDAPGPRPEGHPGLGDLGQ